MSAEVETAAVLADIATERARQRDSHGWTPDHDDLHSTQEWGWLLSKRAVDLTHPWPDEAGLDVRRLLEEIAAIAVAAIESFDRKHPAPVA